MRVALTIFTMLVVCILVGCEGASRRERLTEQGKIPLTVDFQQGQKLRYKFVSSRDIELDWDPTGSRAKPGTNKVSKYSELMEMVVAYRPVKIEPYGSVTVEAKCESVRVKRSSNVSRRGASSSDAVKSLRGKSFMLTVGPTGKIEDYSQLDELIKELGAKAFRSGAKSGRIKEPDMIGDFIATQWFLWDSISSIERAYKGVSVGQSWHSQLSVPSPMVMRKARDVTYTLEETRESEKGRLAVIRSSYTLSDSVPRDWPIPYKGRFRMSGTFGFLRGYKVLDLQGQGEELFNIDAGRIERYNQQYRMQVEAALPIGVGTKPLITIQQNLTMQLLGN